MPLFLRYCTMNGVEVNVIPILTGAKHLWMAYATTNVEAPAPNSLEAIFSPMYGRPLI